MLIPSGKSSEPEEPQGADASTSFAARVEKADAWEEAREKALADPGPNWKEWFLFSGSKVWVALGFFVADIWIVESWLNPVNALGLGLSIVAALYLEFLAYRYLWYRWDPEAPKRSGPFRPTFLRPREVGRWTREGVLAKQGQFPTADGGPRREDFL
ncbi:MAG: hypothetical protein WB786_04995 [Thermoplasmata archaeon]